MDLLGSSPTVIRLEAAGFDDIVTRFGADLRVGGLFVRHDAPPAVQSEVDVSFVRPDGSELGALRAVVVHARTATVPGDPTAGMGLEIVDMDAAMDAVVQRARAFQDRPQEDEDLEPDHLVDRLVDAKPDGVVLGIDLGTTNSCVAVVDGDEPRVLQTPQGYETVPSVVFLSAQNRLYVGRAAVEKMILEPQRAVYGSKRFIGRPYTSREVRRYGHFFHYALGPTSDGRVAAVIDRRLLRLERVAGYVLGVLKRAAAKALGREVKRAVITVPAYFGELQRQAVREAGKHAGLEVERVVNEPTAAAVAFGYGRQLNKTVLVYDFGGGTFDASVLRISGNSMEVLSTDGDPFLGGSDFDDRITEYVLTTIERKHGLNARDDAPTVQRLRFAAEAAKRRLSDVLETTVDVPNLVINGTPVNVSVPIARDLFEGMTEDLVVRSLTIVQSVLNAARVKSSDLDDVIMVGGQSRSPAVRRLLTERFGMQPTRKTHPDHAIALGAAIVGAAAYGGTDLELTDILGRSIRMALEDGGTEVVVPRGEPLPTSKEFGIVTTQGTDMSYRAILLRGEAQRAEDNEILGELRLPSNLALAITRTEAPVALHVSADGLMTASARHPMTGLRHEIAIQLGDVERASGVVELGDGEFELIEA